MGFSDNGTYRGCMEDRNWPMYGYPLEGCSKYEDYSGVTSFKN
jgi:hypothetical protein